ncbi:MAG: fumarylacetoacetate hydrolase family protein [Actinomycetota bacterium]|nr:fumarylacetoacetate hydrolase family protein [Actinomycetota bacterium]
MYLSRHRTTAGPRWALDGRHLPEDFALGRLLEGPAAEGHAYLEGLETGDAAEDSLLPPVEPYQEVWASGVTYEQSREARELESADADAYARVYGADRPELFFKAHGWRVVGHGDNVRVRKDSRWNVPEPELVLVLNSRMETLGYTAGNDVSSRDIEGENPLYLPQAKVYDGSCALGPGIVLVGPDGMRDLPIRLRISRDGRVAFEGEVSTSRMKRSFEELAEYLGRELTLPSGAFLMTGTGIVPEEEFTLTPGDRVEVSVGELVLENDVAGWRGMG